MFRRSAWEGSWERFASQSRKDCMEYVSSSSLISGAANRPSTGRGRGPAGRQDRPRPLNSGGGRNGRLVGLPHGTPVAPPCLLHSTRVLRDFATRSPQERVLSCCGKEPDMGTRLDPRNSLPEVYRAMLALWSCSGHHRSTAVPIASTCTARTCGPRARANHASTSWTPGRGAVLLRPRAGGAGLTEAVTLVAHGHIPDEVYEEARRQFTDDELAKLTLAVVAINGWNRFAIAFRAPAGDYQPLRRHEPAAV